MNAVEIQDVTKTFGAVTAVDGLSLSVPAGSVYGFIGPNGSGKTTTLRMIMNILYPDSGSISVLGEERHEATMDRVGYLPEERGLVHGDVDSWLARLDLTEWAGKHVDALSKGMSQKVQFIAAVAHRPELVILDEPFTGLDPVNLDVLQQAVLDLRAAGTTVIFSTHDMNTAEAMCDYVFMIFQGKKVLDGTLAEVQDRYGTDTIRARIDGDATRLHGLPGVERITDRGQVQELRLASGADSQEVLAAIMSHARVTHFELGRPSLHDIFVRIAGPGAEEADDA
jgi:ABC-2 type transport system ATP-binding protein